MHDERLEHSTYALQVRCSTTELIVQTLRKGVEPLAFRLTVERSNQLS